MTDTIRIVLIALGVALLAVVLLPLLFMSGMMGMMMGGGTCCGGAPWLIGGLALLVLIAGAGLLVAGLRRG